MTELQIDIFGLDVEPEPEPPSYMVEKPKVSQVRLFEPQMEGQLALEASE